MLICKRGLGLKLRRVCKRRMAWNTSFRCGSVRYRFVHIIGCIFNLLPFYSQMPHERLLSLRSNEQAFLGYGNATYLFMFRVLGANVIHSAFPNDNGAAVAHWLDGCTDFHASGESRCK